MTEFEAVVADIREESRINGRQRWQILLNRTAFSSTAATGSFEAVARSGARLQVAVLGVVMEGDELWHVVDKPLAAGTVVTGRVATGSGPKDG
jgi:hypothetical protein